MKASLSGPSLRELPRIDIVLAVHDEASLIAGKLDDLAAQTYPPDRLRLIVVDGGSTDGTVERLHQRAPTLPFPVTVVRAEPRGKVPQLKASLAHASAPWLLVTDADSRFAPDTIDRLAREASKEADVGVVGTCLEPMTTFVLERAHWWLSNALRRAEDWLGGPGLVLGPCYLVRRALVERVPGDGCADDVYVTYLAALAGLRARLVDVRVRELRVPADLLSFVVVRCRRGRDYLRETWRFLPQCMRMRAAGRRAYLIRLALICLLATFGALTSASLVRAVVFGSTGWSGVLALAVSATLAVALLPRVPVWLALPALAVVLGVSVVGALLSAIFGSRGSAYPKSRMVLPEPHFLRDDR